MLCWCVLTPSGKDLLFWLPEEQLTTDRLQLLGSMATESQGDLQG